MQFLSIILILVSAQVSYQMSLNNQTTDGIDLDDIQTNDFDFLVFRQIWPSSSCKFPGNNRCEINKNVSTWVIHGLWPSSSSGKMGPSFCNKSMPFDFEKIKWLLPELLEFWPNLYVNTEPNSFWQHEWEKHGTCALTLPQIHSESDYFNVSLSLRDVYDFGKILEKNSILPNDEATYDLKQIRSAITNELNISPKIECYMQDNFQYIVEAQVCLSKEFKLVECNSKLSSFMKQPEQPCKDGIPVRYPVIKQN